MQTFLKGHKNCIIYYTSNLTLKETAVSFDVTCPTHAAAAAVFVTTFTCSVPVFLHCCTCPMPVLYLLQFCQCLSAQCSTVLVFHPLFIYQISLCHVHIFDTCKIDISFTVFPLSCQHFPHFNLFSLSMYNTKQ